MRSLIALCAAVALWSAGRAEASRPICLEMGVEPMSPGEDGGTRVGHATWPEGATPVLVELPATDDAETAGTADSPPPTVRWVCKRMGYSDEGGCAVAGGAPVAAIALAALGLVSRRARRAGPLRAP